MWIADCWHNRKKFSLAGNNLIIPRWKSSVNDIPAGDGKIDNIFLQCILIRNKKIVLQKPAKNIECCDFRQIC